MLNIVYTVAIAEISESALKIKKNKQKPNFVPTQDKRKGSENRKPTGMRERNVMHPNGEEHSRVPKGNRGVRQTESLVGVSRTEALVGIAISSAVIATIVLDDFTIIGTTNDVALVPMLGIWWDYAAVFVN